MKTHKAIAVVTAWTWLAAPSPAQQPLVERPAAMLPLRPYKPASIPPVSLRNSDRIRTLLRSGKLYLTLRDAVALAIENNLDLEVNRYGPLAAEWSLERAQAGGPLRGVTSGSSFANQITGGQGVAGALLSAGLAAGGSAVQSSGNVGSITQIGPVAPNLDAVFQNTSGWFHSTIPQPNAQVSQTTALIDTTHRFSSFVQQGLISGGFVQVATTESYLKENSPGDLLSPSVAPIAQITVRHNFLNGFGPGVNSRFIRVARKNLVAANETLRLQLSNLVADVAGRYWDLVAANDDRKARQGARDAAQKFVDDTNQMIALGAVARADIFRPEGELAMRRLELGASEEAVRRQETELKNVLSRDGLEDPLLEAAEVVPLDRIEIPGQDNLAPLRELVARAMAKRPDMALASISRETAEISASGTANGILPFFAGLAAIRNSGTAGTQNPLSSQLAAPNIVGGLGTALAQIFRGDFNTRQGLVQFQALLGNHVAQGDYGVDQLQLRQGDLVQRRSQNQLVVDISNQMVALRQARARYSAAVENSALQQQLLEKTRQSFSLGASTINDVSSAQRDAAAAEATEVSARASYSRARVALDQVLGETLEANHVSLEEGLKGRVANQSEPPATAR